MQCMCETPSLVNQGVKGSYCGRCGGTVPPRQPDISIRPLNELVPEPEQG